MTAQSSGDAILPMGMVERISGSRSSIPSLDSEVATHPGAIPKSSIPVFAYSTARLRVRLMMAALDAAYIEALASPRNPTRLATLRIFPPPCA